MHGGTKFHGSPSNCCGDVLTSNHKSKTLGVARREVRGQ